MKVLIMNITGFDCDCLFIDNYFTTAAFIYINNSATVNNNASLIAVRVGTIADCLTILLILRYKPTSAGP